MNVWFVWLKRNSRITCYGFSPYTTASCGVALYNYTLSNCITPPHQPICHRQHNSSCFIPQQTSRRRTSSSPGKTGYQDWVRSVYWDSGLAAWTVGYVLLWQRIYGTNKEAISHQHIGVIAVLCSLRCCAGQKQPKRIRDFMGYQTLIIDAYLEYKSNCWMGYDWSFRQMAASEPGRSWASIDPTLWNLAFAGQEKTTWCTHCFSLSHQSDDCKLSLRSMPQPSDQLPSMGQGTRNKAQADLFSVEWECICLMSIP